MESSVQIRTQFLNKELNLSREHYTLLERIRRYLIIHFKVDANEAYECQ